MICKTVYPGRGMIAVVLVLSALALVYQPFGVLATAVLAFAAGAAAFVALMLLERRRERSPGGDDT